MYEAGKEGSQVGENAYSKHVVHECTTTGTNFNQLDSCFLAALGQPFGQEPYTNELTKDLGDFWRCNEVAFEAELVTTFFEGAGVVAPNICRQAHAHVTGEWNRAGQLRHLHVSPWSRGKYKS